MDRDCCILSIQEAPIADRALITKNDGYSCQSAKTAIQVHEQHELLA